MTANATQSAVPTDLDDHSDEHIQLVAAGLVKLVGSEAAAGLLSKLYGEERATDALRSLADRVSIARRNLEVREEYMQRAARRARRRRIREELRVSVGDESSDTTEDAAGATTAADGAGGGSGERRDGSGRIVRDDLERVGAGVDRAL